jgi:hypothetical protein
MHIPPDFDYAKSGAGADLQFVHRELAHGDIYFVDNRSDRAVKVEATFRVAGRMPQLWRAETGRTAPVSFTIAQGRTTVPLTLEPWGTVFVVFGKATAQTSWAAPAQKETRLAAVTGPWKVSFPPDWGAPPSITLNTLSSWSSNPNAGVKYFSGTGTYTKTVEAPASWFRHHAQLWIDLGDVENLADVTVNGKDLGIVWHRPFRVNATTALHPGRNELTIRVTDLWVNRLIGDQQPGAAKKYTFTDFKPYNAHSPLLPSGLLGPVIFDAVTK